MIHTSDLITRTAKVNRNRQRYRHDPLLDSFRDYVTDHPTAAKIVSLLKGADDGEIGPMIQLAQEVEGKDAHLQGVANTRRNSVTALDWEIMVPERVTPELETLAEEAAAYCQDALDSIPTWEVTLEHLSTAIGPNVAVTELLWDHRAELVETVDVPGHRLVGGDFGEIRIETLGDPWGVPAPLGKFIVFVPNLKPVYPFAVTLTRATAMLYLIKHFCVADWSAFSEKFGMPLPIGKYPQGSPPEVKTALADFLKDFTSDSWGMVPEGVEIDALNFGSQGAPYEGLIKWLEDKQTILYLGQTLTTSTGSVGSFAAAKVHDNVRADILLSDVKKEARCIRQQVLRPMVGLKFPGRDVPIPIFKRRLIEQKNLDEDRVALEQLRFAQESGLFVDDAVKYEKLNIPQPVQETQE